VGQVVYNANREAHTIARVAQMFGEDEDWLSDVAGEMDPEDGMIWVYGPGDDGVMALTDFGIETLAELVRAYRAGHRARAGPLGHDLNTCGPHRTVTNWRIVMSSIIRWRSGLMAWVIVEVSWLKRG